MIYYVDATLGDDTNNGQSTATAWKTVNRVNDATFLPGDSILFKRGETWREALIIPNSGGVGNYITVGAYDAGSKPKLLGSIQLNNISNWIDEGSNIWRSNDKVVTGAEKITNPSFDVDLSDWTLWTDAGANASVARDVVVYDSSPASAKISCVDHGATTDDVQFFTSAGGITIEKYKYYKLTFRAKASEAFQIAIGLQKNVDPYTDYSSFSAGNAPIITTDWQTYEVIFRANIATADARIGFFLGLNMPNGADLWIDTLSFKELSANRLLDDDVGNIVFDSEVSCGVKKWSESELLAQGNFYYDSVNDVVKMYSLGNPAGAYSNIEMCLRNSGIDGNNLNYLMFENLDVRYSGGHAFGLGYCHHQIIRDNDISYCGGSELFALGIRYGNAVEFWRDAEDCIVERNRISQMYDTGITNQAGTETFVQRRIYFRNNIIDHCEWSMEVGIWSYIPASDSVMSNIYYENNTCLNAGRGWSHNQRPDNEKSCNIRLCPVSSVSGKVYIRNNVCYDSLDYNIAISIYGDLSRYVLDNNCYFSTVGKLVIIENPEKIYTYDQFEDYKTLTGQDEYSVTEDPLFQAGTYKPQPYSACVGGGFNTPYVTEDYLGVARPFGLRHDIGAYENTVKCLKVMGHSGRMGIVIEAFVAHQLRIKMLDAVYGIPLVALDDPNASPVKIRVNGVTKAPKKL